MKTSPVDWALSLTNLMAIRQMAVSGSGYCGRGMKYVSTEVWIAVAEA